MEGAPLNTAEINILPVLIVLIPIWIIIRLTILKRKNFTLSYHECLVNIFFIYMLVVAHITLFPIQFALPTVFHFNIIPFYSIYDAIINFPISIQFRIILGNIMLFIPFGFFLGFIWTNKFNHIWTVASASFICSLAIELFQLSQNNRYTNVDDLILNTLGGVIGYGILKLFKKYMR